MMQRRLTTRPTVAVKPALRARRPPEQFVDLLTKSEDEFRREVERLESEPLFQQLLEQGLLSKVRFHGKIPPEKYQEFMDRRLFQFLEESGITQREGWDKELLTPSALRRIPELAQKYGVREGTLARYVRYLQSTQRDDLPPERFPSSVRSLDEETFDPLETARSDTYVDLSDIIEVISRFKEKYDLTEQEFLDDILHGELTAEELAERFGCTLGEAEEILEVVDKFTFAEIYEAETQAAPAPAAAAPREEAEPVAQVNINDDGTLAIQVSGDSLYVQRYRIKTKSEELSPEVKDLLYRARFVNQRASALSRLVSAICEYQSLYLASGNPLHLKPLAQADLARKLGEHPSTISRLIRDKIIATPHGRFPLIYFCQSKTDVVARVVQEYPDLSDSKIQQILARDYNCKIARRTVAYHRGKRERREPPGAG